MTKQELIDKFSEIRDIARVCVDGPVARQLERICEQVEVDWQIEQRNPLPELTLEFADRLEDSQIYGGFFVDEVADQIRRHYGQMD